MGLMRLGTSQQQHNTLQGFYEEENASQAKYITLQIFEEEKNATEEHEFAHNGNRFLEFSEVGKVASGMNAVSTVSFPAQSLEVCPTRFFAK